MGWLLALAVCVYVPILCCCIGYSNGYDRGYGDRLQGEPHRDDRPPSWRRRLFDLTCDTKESDDGRA